MDIMYRHGLAGPLHRGKRKSAFSRQLLRSRRFKATYGRVAGMREAGLEGICANILSYKLLTSSGLGHMPTDLGNLE